MQTRSSAYRHVQSFSENRHLKKKAKPEVSLCNVDSSVKCARTHCPVPVPCWGTGRVWRPLPCEHLLHCFRVAGLDKMSVISTTSKQEQEVFVLSTQTVGSFPTPTTSQGAGIQVLKY